MLKRLMTLLLLLLVLGASALAEETPAPFTAYFEKTVFLRPAPAASSDSLGAIPALTVIELTPVNDRFALVTWQGKTGYVYYAEALRLPEAEEGESYLAYLPENKYLFALPADGAPALLTVPAETPVTVTAEVGRFLRIEVGETTGYVYARDAKAIDSLPVQRVDAEICAQAAVVARRYPLAHAPEVLRLETGRVFVAEAVVNAHYRITLGDQTVYVPVSAVVTLSSRPETVRAAIITPDTLLFAAPEQAASVPERLPQTCLMRLDPMENGFQRLHGTAWYVRTNDVQAWSAQPQEGLRLQVTAEAPLLLTPEAGAETVGCTQAGALHAQVCAVGEWYLLPAGEGWGFLHRDDPAVTALPADEKMLRTAAVTQADTALYGAGDAPVALSAGVRVFVTAGAGDFLRVTSAAGEGYVHRDALRILGSDTPLTVHTVTAPADLAVLDFPDAALGVVKGRIPEGTALRVTGFNRCYLMVTGGGYTGYVAQEGLLTAESRGIPATEDVPAYTLVLDKSTGMCYVFQQTEEGERGELVLCAEVGIGKRTTPTPTGTYLLGNKERWHAFSHTYTPHTTEYVRARYIHGWPCVERTNTSVKTGLMVTGMVTGGCLRSPFEFAEWVYKNCPSYVTELTIVSGGFEAPEDAEAVQLH